MVVVRSRGSGDTVGVWKHRTIRLVESDDVEQEEGEEIGSNIIGDDDETGLSVSSC